MQFRKMQMMISPTAITVLATSGKNSSNRVPMKSKERERYYSVMVMPYYYTCTFMHEKYATHLDMRKLSQSFPVYHSAV